MSARGPLPVPSVPLAGPQLPAAPPPLRGERGVPLRSTIFFRLRAAPPSAACRPSVGNVRSRRTGFGARVKHAHSLAWLRSRPFASGYARRGRCLGCRAARPVGCHRREPFKLTRSHGDTRNNLTTFSSTMSTDAEHDTAQINITAKPPTATQTQKKKVPCRLRRHGHKIPIDETTPPPYAVCDRKRL